MIGLIIDMLQSDKWLDAKSEYVEIAKGKHELVKTMKDAKIKLKRKWQLKK